MKVSSARTRIEPAFDPEAVRQLKATAERDIGIGGADLAAQAIRAGLVDEYQLSSRPSWWEAARSSLPTMSAFSSTCWTNAGSATGLSFSTNGVVFLHYRSRA